MPAATFLEYDTAPGAAAGGGWVKAPSSGRVARLARSRLALTGLRGGCPESGPRTLSSGDPPQDRAHCDGPPRPPPRGNRDGRYIPPPARGTDAGGGGSMGRVRLGGRLPAQPLVHRGRSATARRRVLGVRLGLLAALDRAAASVAHHRVVLHARDHARRSWSASGQARVVSALHSRQPSQWSARVRYRSSAVVLGCGLTGSPSFRGVAVRGPFRRRPARRRTARIRRHVPAGWPADVRRHRCGSRGGAR